MMFSLVVALSLSTTQEIKSTALITNEVDPISALVIEVEQHVRVARRDGLQGIIVDVGSTPSAMVKRVAERLTRKGYMVEVEEIYPPYDRRVRYPAINALAPSTFRLCIYWK